MQQKIFYVAVAEVRGKKKEAAGKLWSKVKRVRSKLRAKYVLRGNSDHNNENEGILKVPNILHILKILIAWNEL